MAVTLLLPKSVGYVHIQSTDPFVHPTIQPNYLTDVDGVRPPLDRRRRVGLARSCGLLDNLY